MAHDIDPERAQYYSQKMDEIMGEEDKAGDDEEFNEDFNFEGINMEEENFGKIADSMPPIAVSDKATMPPLPARAVKVTRHNKPDDKNESGEEPAQPRRSGRSAKATKQERQKQTHCGVNSKLLVRLSVVG
jgi:hypothetical protein